RTWLWVIASTDPAHTTAALASHYPRELCVIRSKYQQGDVQRIDSKVVALLANHGQDGVCGGGGRGLSDDWQALVEVSVIADTPPVHPLVALGVGEQELQGPPGIRRAASPRLIDRRFQGLVRPPRAQPAAVRAEQLPPGQRTPEGVLIPAQDHHVEVGVPAG